MSAMCAKPGCSNEVAGWFATSRTTRAVVIQSTESSHATGLCEIHLERFSVPKGWELTDRRGVEDEHPGPWFAPDTDPDEIESDLPPDGSLLARAFMGPDSSAEVPAVSDGVDSSDTIDFEARRLSRLERIQDQIDGGPEGPGGGEKEQREDRSDAEHGDQEGDSVEVGPGQRSTDQQNKQQKNERRDRIDSYGTDELPFPPLESEPTSRAALG